MMKCQDVTRRASAYLDGDLPLRERLSVRMHLFICINCRRYMSQLGTTLELVRARSWAKTEPEAEDRLVAMFRSSRPDKDGSAFTCT